MVFNPCELELPGTLTGSFQLSQSGTQLSVIDQGEVVGSGSLNFSSPTRYTAETVITFSNGVIVCTLRTTDVGSR